MRGFVAEESRGTSVRVCVRVRSQRGIVAGPLARGKNPAREKQNERDKESTGGKGKRESETERDTRYTSSVSRVSRLGSS